MRLEVWDLACWLLSFPVIMPDCHPPLRDRPPRTAVLARIFPSECHRPTRIWHSAIGESVVDLVNQGRQLRVRRPPKSAIKAARMRGQGRQLFAKVAKKCVKAANSGRRSPTLRGKVAKTTLTPVGDLGDLRLPVLPARPARQRESAGVVWRGEGGVEISPVASAVVVKVPSGPRRWLAESIAMPSPAPSICIVVR